ncbi:hypothetical protein SLEP1_g11137 [Rubroshorea leprosula]|uniref:Transposase DDE domain-containing protein n=1 Tax=Rubroshorea leprosula TaxID=152421 RepID=A0AAV5IIA0_9ROSI|nr:hypothetical protein SLEP1_g11137 [Rubroshorea leprosula]
MKWKYGSEQWFQEKPVSERIFLKDAQKFAVFDVHFNKGIKIVQNYIGRIQDCKRRKRGMSKGLHSVIDEYWMLVLTVRINQILRQMLLLQGHQMACKIMILLCAMGSP